MSDLPTLNVKHINKILDHIRGDLKRLWMPRYGIRKGTEAAKDEKLRSFAACGTACCFAGWSKLLSMPKREWGPMFCQYGDFDVSTSEELERLGLTDDESRLFVGVGGTRRRQFKVLKDRLRRIIQERVEKGETSGLRIKL